MAQVISSITVEDFFLVILRTFIVFIFLFIMLRLRGKKSLAQLTFFDLAIVIALGSAVGDAMIYREAEAQLMKSLIAIGFVVIMVIAIDKLITKNTRIGRLLEGKETILIKDGKINYHNLAAENLSKDELISKLHERNMRQISEVKLAILEPTGGFSIVRKGRVSKEKVKVGK